MLYKLTNSNKFNNTMILYPHFSFFITNGKRYINKVAEEYGNISGETINHVPTGFVSLFEMNVNRPANGMIYPFIFKGSNNIAMYNTENYNSNYQYGDMLTGSYPLSASIDITYYDSSTRPNVKALKNTTNFYKRNHPCYNYNTKDTDNLTLIDVPSIIFGSSIKKGSVTLNVYYSGSLVAQAKDLYKNGALYETTGSAVGSVIGSTLYNEGFVILTGSHVIDNPDTPHWYEFANGYGNTFPSSSYEFIFDGTQHVQTNTYLCKAAKNELNNSNNPTFIEYGQTSSPITGSKSFVERRKLTIKNIVSSSYDTPTGSFQKQTYISSILLYDKDKNVVGVAKVATPILKTENRDYMFKLKIDVA